MEGERVVLYVEDDDATYTLVRIILAEQAPEIQLLRAGDGEQALKLLRRQPPYENSPLPDLILLDWNLPRKNGFELLSDLKQEDGLRSIPVVMFSSSSSRAAREVSLKLGARDYVTKPSTFESFVDAVKAACYSPDR
jgi:two-component system, chemotaxis family, response regulator Rcp1